MGLRRSLQLRRSLRWRLGVLLATASVAVAAPALANAAAPDGVTALALDGRVELAWQPAAGAASYRVYRGTAPTAVTTQIATGVLTTFTTDSAATNGTTFYYSVRAVIGGVESPDSRLVEATPRARSCSTGNPIVVENCFPGATTWNVASPATVNGIEGFATATSINKGESVDLKVNSPVGYRIEIYRSGYYGDTGGRLISAIRGVPGAAQPACTTDTPTGLVDCANWATSQTITTTASWPTGVYLLRLIRDDNGNDTHVLFVVRDDARASAVLYGVGFTDFQAYNGYAGKSLYDFNSNGTNTVAGTPRAVKVSFDRPYKQASGIEPNWYTKIEHQLVSWLEASGYDVGYQSDTDLERNGARVRNHRLYILPAHDEYYSAGMRTALEQSRDAGVNLFSTGANQVYWKIRFENGAGGQDRIQVCYKSTQSGGADPSGIPTGTWRDPNGANKPENALLGAMYVGDNDQASFPLRISAAEGADRLFRFTGLDAQPTGTSTAIGTDLVGWEWDARVSNGFEPAGVRTLGSSPATGQLLTDAGRVYAPGSATVNIVKYRAASGALVVSVGTNQFDRGLLRTRNGEGTADVRIHQFTTNVLADMGAVPETPLAGVTADDPSGTTIAAPTGVTATPEGTDAIRVSWMAVAGATGYRVYRANAARTAGVPVGTLASGTPVTTNSFSDFGLNAGATYFYVVTAVKGPVQSPFSSEVSATTDGFAGGSTVRINSGGGAYTSTLGRVYSADTSFTGGAGFTTINPISGTTDPALYQNERWGQFSYSIPVANGTYDVRFHFVELYYGTEIPGSCVGKRIFGMDILDTAGTDIPPTMDVCAEAGVRTALVKIVRGIQITDGAVDVRSVYGAVDDPELAAIEVVPATSAAPPTVTTTSPAAGATGVATTANVTATFSRAMDGATITGTSFTLTGPGGAVPATVSYGPESQIATLTPAAALATSTTYTARLGTTIRASDGIALAAPVTWTFTTAAPPADTTPPATAITAPPAGAVTGTVNVTASASDNVGVAGVQFKLDGANLGIEDTTAPYSVSWDTTTATAGAHTLTSVARDAAGNTTTSAPVSVDVQNTPPTAAITAGPTGTTNSASASFSFTAEAGATFQCSRDGAAFAACTSPQAYTGLADGSHTFQVRATNAAGTGPTASRTWTIDTTAPTVTITAGPTGTTNATAASFSFSSEAGATFQCALDAAAFTACTSPQAYTGLADASHTFQVKATDAAGNAGTAATRTWTIDTTPPTVTITAGPTGTTNSTSASLSFSSEAGATLQCALDGAPFAACTSPQAYTGLADGSHTFQVRAADQAGNTGTASRTWTIDATPPTATISAGPTGTTTSASASFSFASEPGATFQCALDAAAFAACTSPQAYTGLADGSHTFQVRATDGAGNTGTAASRTWTVDTTAPTVTITAGPNGATTSSSASFSFGSEAGATFQCALDGAAFTTCVSPQAYTGLAEGSHTFQVNATDSVGNTGSAASRAWSVDTTAPTVTITAGPTGTTNATAASFSFSSEAGATFQCALDGAAFTACTSPQAYTGVAEGAHTFQVKATDAAGNAGTPAARSWTIDTTPPGATITGGPSGTTNATAASFSFTSEAGASFECALDGAPFAGCTSPQAYTALADGSHTFQLRAADQAGNTSTASRTWTIDTTPPTVTITAGPVGTTTATGASFSFTSEAGAAFACSLDGGPFTSCTSPNPYLGLADGSHTFQVKATDAAGNAGPAASRTWTVDTTPPDVTVTAGPSGTTNSAAASFSFTSEAGATFQCALDGAAFTGCASPQAYTGLADGAHTFRVRASDPAGNTGTPASRAWTIDTTAPAVTITGGPNGATTSSGASLTFTSEAGATFQCALDGAAFTTCTSPQAYTALAEGAHTFQVKATDQAGNTGTAASRTWSIDTIPPTVTITQTPASSSNAASPSFSFTSEAGATFQCALDAAAFATCVSPQAYTGLADGSHTFQVKATDAAGNAGTAATYTWTIDTTAPAATITAGPSGTTNSAAASFSFTSETGATLQCALDGAPFTACTSPQAYTALGDGSHTFQIRATDAAGNASTASRTWTIDTTAPAATITAGATGTTNAASASFSFTAEAGATFECALDAAAFAACTSPQAYTALADGSHTFRVRATDAAGNTGTAASRTWTIDTTPAAATITQSPAALSNSAGASFSFTSEAGATFECALDAAAFAACTSPQAYSGLAEGSHTFQVRATDAAGNTGTAASRTWTVDTTPPGASITAGPSGTTNATGATFSFTSEAGAAFQCALDGAALAACTSPQAYTALADGSHTFQVRATDAAGNASTATRTWTIDTAAPAATITAGPTGTTNSANASFSFTSEAGATFRCSLDGAPSASCTSPQAYTALANGSHTFEVQATDLAGNTGAAASRTWTVDATAPTVTVTAPVAGTTVSGTTTITATAADNVGVAGVQFKVDGVNVGVEDTAAPYSVAWDSTTATNASHTITAVARDAAGSSTTSAGVTVTTSNGPPDTTAPTVAITAPAADSMLSGTITVTATASDDRAVAGVQFKLDGANLGAEDTAAPYSVSWTASNSAAGPHTLTAVARDAAANTGTSNVNVLNAQRINTGGAALTATGGVQWVADARFTGGSTHVSTSTITGTTDQALYRNERWGQFSYAVPVVNGVYDVRFHFVELYYGTTIAGPCVGKRIFGMNIVDTPAQDISNLDICAAVGPNAALVRTITGVNVTDGTLNIASVYGSVDDPEVAAIEVIPNTGPPPPPTVTSKTPADGATNVATGTAVSAVFSRAMDPVTITSGTFTLAPPAGSAVAATVTYNSATSTATVTPAAALANSTTYTARLDAAVKAADGTPLAAPVSWTFTTAAPPPPPDTTPPTAAVTAPTGGTVTGTITVTADATDDRGVAGVQFKLDGANLGAEDTTAPYSVSWTTNTATNGDHVLTAVARDAANNTTTSAAVTVTVQNTGPAPGTTTVRINSGDAAFTTGGGLVFQADAMFTGGGTWSSTSAIAGTTDDALYQNERWGQFSYAIPVTNGAYDVRFHFVELYYGTTVAGACVGKRVFGMDIADTPGQDIANLDVCAAVGPNAALVRTITGVNVTDGTLNVASVYGSIDDPELAAIEVVPATG